MIFEYKLVSSSLGVRIRQVLDITLTKDIGLGKIYIENIFMTGIIKIYLGKNFILTSHTGLLETLLKVISFFSKNVSF